MGRTLWCSRCDAGYQSIGGDVPRVCPHCSHETVWRTLAPVDSSTPIRAWELTLNDRRFLRSIHVLADVK